VSRTTENGKSAVACAVEGAIREVARGERPWSDLRSFGMDLSPRAGHAYNLPPTSVRVTVHDVASGFVSCLHDPTALREWAFVMETVPADFEAVEAHPEGEVVLGALWNASFGEPLSEAEIEVIHTLVGKHGGDA
jgi:hypothetical protein